MKTFNFCIIKVKLLLFLMFFFTIGVLKAQSLLKDGDPPTTNYIDHSGNLEFGVGNLGIGVFPALARLHMRSTGFQTQPLFKADVWNALGELASIQHFVTDGIHNYGIFQTSKSYLGLLNYFQDPLQIGNIRIGNDGTQTLFETSYETSSILFIMRTSAPNPFYPFKISPGGISVTGFQLTDNPGEGKVLASDADGNGIWTTASTFNDGDWLVETNHGERGSLPMNLYSNPIYTNVGIGTTSPISKLHVMDGNILISRSPSDAPGSINGSMLFGEVVSNTWPLGEWGIEYERLGDYSSGGLNFWKVASDNTIGDDNILFLKNNGNVGVGTANPNDKLQVNDGIGMVVIGIGSDHFPNEDRPTNLKKIDESTEQDIEVTSGLGYIGFNTTRNSEGWLVKGNGTRNSGTLIYHDSFGGMNFCVFPDTGGSHGDQLFDWWEMDNKNRLKIAYNGNIGMGNPNPMQKLDVNSNEATFIRARSNGPDFSGFMAQNSSGGYRFLVDNNGIGRITELGCTSIISFHSGNVDFAGNVGVAGKVGIGNVDLSQYTNSTSKLFVEGGITTEAVHVKMQASGWSDFVFADNYKKMSISDLDHFIKVNKHLPDIPSKDDVDSNGIELSKMNALLLQKIEELTLYIIDQQKQIDLIKQTLKK